MQKTSDDPARRVAVVTGSSRGIGASIAKQLAHDGFNIVLNYSSSGSASLAEEVALFCRQEYGAATRVVQADVASWDESKHLIDCARDELGRIDVLVNNAGIIKDSLLAGMTEQDFDEVIAVDLKGTFNCCRHAIAPMMKQRYGRIINIASFVGVWGNAGQTNYAASKAGVIGLTKSIAKEVAPRKITANAVAPGFIETDMTLSLPDAVREKIVSRISTRRIGAPEDVAYAVSFLAAEEASYITGQVLGVDGGLIS